MFTILKLYCCVYRFFQLGETISHENFYVYFALSLVYGNKIQNFQIVRLNVEILNYYYRRTVFTNVIRVPVVAERHYLLQELLFTSRTSENV